MAEYSQKWHNETSSKARSTKTSDGLAAIQAQLNNLWREIKKVHKKVYAAQFGAPYQPGGQYRAAGPGFYQRTNRNSLYPDRRQTLEESLTKFMVESAKRHKENSNIIKEIRASTDATIRNQGASIKTLEIQIGQMSKVLQEREIGGLPSSTKPNPRDHVNSISTAKSDSSVIRRIGSGPYVVSDAQYSSLSSETVPTDLGSKTEFVGEAINESFDPLYGNYIELNDLDMPLELRMNQDDFEPTLDFINESTYKSFKDKGDQEGKNLAGTLIDIPIFIGNFSIISGFSITDDMDITSGVVLGMPFCKKFVSCQKIIERFAHGDECERTDNE
ncbi:hypothetical protein Tco_0093532 [Tanacetum coccineum]